MEGLNQLLITVSQKIGETDAETLITAAVSLVSVFIGAFLGWMISALSQKGKLTFVSDYKGEFMKDHYGEAIPCSSRQEACYYKYSLRLDMYNNSQATKVIRSIQIRLYAGQNLIEELPFIERNGGKGVNTPIKIRAKDSESVELDYRWTLDMFQHPEEIWNVNKVYFTYIDQKGRTRRKKIEDVDYASLFREERG